MKLGRLNHIGLAVPNIMDAVENYKLLYGIASEQITDIGEMPNQGVRYCFVNLENSQLELIEPLGDNSPIAKFLEKNPNGGQHHVCFEVEDIFKARDYMQNQGAAILGEPRIGAHGTLIIFVHPKNSNGVLVELMETPKSEKGAH
jgi:methylmalonyl-CoA/ethylmalonyl-CoA epimerase